MSWFLTMVLQKHLKSATWQFSIVFIWRCKVGENNSCARKETEMRLQPSYSNFFQIDFLARFLLKIENEKSLFFCWKGVIGFERGVIIGHAAKNIQDICSNRAPALRIFKNWHCKFRNTHLKKVIKLSLGTILEMKMTLSMT